MAEGVGEGRDVVLVRVLAVPLAPSPCHGSLPKRRLLVGVDFFFLHHPLKDRGCEASSNDYRGLPREEALHEEEFERRHVL